MKYRIVLRKLYEKITSDELNILLSLLLLLIIIVVVPTVILGGYGKRGFLESIWANVNTMVIELLILGIILKLLTKVSSKRKEIQQYLNEIDNSRFWNDQNAARRIRKCITSLNQLGISQIDLNNCYISNAQLEGVTLVDSNLWKANFEECDLENSDLQKSDFWSANLKGAVLRRANLSDANLDSCILTKADLSGAILKDACLKNSTLLDADLTDSILDNADLTGVKGISPLQLSKAKSAINIKADDKLLDKARSIKPNLFEIVGTKSVSGDQSGDNSNIRIYSADNKEME